MKQSRLPLPHAAQRLAHQLTPAVRRPYTARRPKAKPPTRVRSTDGRRPETGVDQKLRAASCMRLLDRTLAGKRFICLWNGKPERLTKRKNVLPVFGRRLVAEVAEDLNLG